MVASPLMVSVRSASPVVSVNVRAAVRSEPGLMVSECDALVSRTLNPVFVIPVYEPPVIVGVVIVGVLIVGLVSVLAVSVCVVSVPTSVVLASGTVIVRVVPVVTPDNWN